MHSSHPSRLFRLAALMLIPFAGVACARYEFDVVNPPLAQPRAGTSEDLIVDIAPLRYRFRTQENRLVVRIFNPTAEVIRLVGVKSAVTDPTGQARPLRSQPIPPGAFAKFILPPVRPEFVGRGSSSGSRTRAGDAWVRHGDSAYGPGLGRSEFGYGYDEPTSYTLRDAGEIYWDWQGETQAKMTLVFEQAGQEFTHQLQFARTRAD